MQLKIALLAVSIIFAASYTASAAGEYYFAKSWGGQGLVKTGAFTFPQHVAVDSAGNVYVTDLGNARVQKFDGEGTFLHAWGSKGTRSSEFHSPAGIAIGGGHVYVVDHELNSVKKFDTNGKFVTSWGTTGSGTGELRLPNGIAVSKDNHVYVTDTGNSRIQKFDSSGKFVAAIGSSGTGDGQFLTPLGVAVDSDGNLYVGDYGNKRIQKFDSEGSFVKSFSAASGGLQIQPDGIAVDSSGNMIIADITNNRIVVLDKDGKTKSVFGKTGTGNGQFNMVKDVAVMTGGTLFAVDSSNHRIQKLNFNTQPTQTSEPQTVQTQNLQAQTTQTQLSTAPDLKKPTIVPPKDIYVEATSGLTTVSLGQAIANADSGISSLTNNAPQQFPLGITTVIWTAIDNLGNVGIATQTVTVGDTTPPVISGLSNITKEAQGLQNTVDLGYPEVIDQVGVMSIENDAPESFSLGDTKVTWTAIDVAKNTATFVQTVKIVDTTPPTLRAPAGVEVEATSLDKNTVTLGDPTVTDNTDVVTVTNDSPEFFPIGETVVTWTAIDMAGNVADAVQKVTVTDTVAPVMGQPDELIIEAVSVTSNPVELTPPEVTDIQQASVTNDAPELFPIGETTVTWLATDLSGNNSTITQKVNVVDTTPPVLTVPEDVIQEATGPEGNIVVLGDPVVEDVSEIISITNDAPEEYPFGTTIVNWTATDKYENSASASQTVTIIDTTEPTITAPKDVVFEATGITENIVSLGELNASDLVGIESITNDAPEHFALGDTTVTWTATDTSGNTATASQLVTVVDTTPPVIVVPEDMTVEAESPSGTQVSFGTATATDAIGVESITNDSPAVFDLGLTQITWTAVDSWGNTATATQNVTVVDTTPPVISVPEEIMFEATSASENVVPLEAPHASDDVSSVTITNDSPESFPLGETIVTWTATDASGNTSTATQKVTVVDTVPPTITAPADITVEATSKLENIVELDAAIASDNVGVDLLTNDAPEFFPVGETIVTWTATDVSGLSSTTTQTVSVIDTTKPVIKVSDIKAEATSEHDNSVDLGNVSADDNVEVDSLTNDAPDRFSLGVTIVTWTATDEAGNVATATQTVTLVDTASPTIESPADVVFEATSASENVVPLEAPHASDDVSSVTITNDSPESFPLGETIVTWTATDASGNTSTATQKVTVVDTVPPTITAPADITVEAASSSDNVVNLDVAIVHDNVGMDSVTNDSPESFPLGETIVTWTATDASGNTSTATQKVTVVDTVPPTITAPDDITVEAASSSDNVVDLEIPPVSDNVGVDSLTNDAPEFFPVGETIVTWTATDEAGNSSTITQKITVVDTVPPQFARMSPVVAEATSTDNNHIELDTTRVSDIQDIVSLTNDSPESFSLGETIVTWTATDASGNTSTATQKVTVVDTVPPTITAPDDITVEATSAEANTVRLGDAQADDAVSVLSLTNDSPEFFPVGETIVTWTATDASGNNATATQIVTLVDTTAPTIIQPENVVFEATSASENVVPLEAPHASDDVSSVTITNDSPESFPLGETIVTWTATDEAGNSSSITQKVTVVDTQPPELVIPDNIVINAVSLRTPVTIGKATVSDLTDAAPKLTNDAPTLFSLGETVITWTTVDTFGNSVSKTQTITVEACGRPESEYNVIMGTDEDDILHGTRNADLIIGLGGNNIIYGERGNNCILVGNGDNVIYGGEGNDYVHVGNGDNVILGKSGNDTVIAGTGYNIIDGGTGRNTCVVQENNDGVVVNCELRHALPSPE